jgi:uncharacterized protein (DUF1697 family)
MATSSDDGTTWVALLRGVNVNGITVKSAELAALFRELGFDDVTTILASGNVRFGADGDPSSRPAVKKMIEQGLRDRFGYDAWIVLVTIDELRAAVDAFPFDDADAERQPYIVFGSDQAALDGLAEAAADLDPTADPLRRGREVIYWNPLKGTSTDTAFAKIAGRAAYRSVTTTRNLRTLAKILR